MNDKLAWYISRSSGWVAFVLLAVTVVWGILGITKVVERSGLPRWMMDLHKYLALLTIVFTAVHLGGLVADNFVHIGWRENPGAVRLRLEARRRDVRNRRLLLAHRGAGVVVAAPAAAAQGVEVGAHAVVPGAVARGDARPSCRIDWATWQSASVSW